MYWFNTRNFNVHESVLVDKELAWKNYNKMMRNDEKTDLFTKLQSESFNIQKSDKKDDDHTRLCKLIVILDLSEIDEHQL